MCTWLWSGGKRGVWKPRSVETAECRSRSAGVPECRSIAQEVENAECGTPRFPHSAFSTRPVVMDILVRVREYCTYISTKYVSLLPSFWTLYYFLIFVSLIDLALLSFLSSNHPPPLFYSFSLNFLIAFVILTFSSFSCFPF